MELEPYHHRVSNNLNVKSSFHRPGFLSSAARDSFYFFIYLSSKEEEEKLVDWNRSKSIKTHVIEAAIQSTKMTSIGAKAVLSFLLLVQGKKIPKSIPMIESRALDCTWHPNTFLDDGRRKKKRLLLLAISNSFNAGR